jgi:hypothetical protein
MGRLLFGVMGRKRGLWAMRRRTIEERYRDNVRGQRRELLEFVRHEVEWAEHLIAWYRCKKLDMPDDEYRAVAFFTNKEYQKKRGSLTLLYKMYLRCLRELPDWPKEHGFDLLRFRYRMYAKTLEKGGF